MMSSNVKMVMAVEIPAIKNNNYCPVRFDIKHADWVDNQIVFVPTEYLPAE